GIGGLVCGCYLAKAGLKVLIVEKNDKVGGYCTSFERDGYRFDAGVHGIGGWYEMGSTYHLIIELNIDIEWEKKEPAESIYFKNKYLINFWSDLKKTKEELYKSFPAEREGISKFINFILTNSYFSLFKKYSNKSFKNLLDDFFADCDLKSILTIPCGNIGASARSISALSAFSLYKEFLFHSHVYPKGGICAFAEKLRDKFIELHGIIKLKNEVIKIIQNHMDYYIITKNGNRFQGKTIVLNIAPHQLFTIFKQKLLLNEVSKMFSSLSFSPSAFFVNLGLNKNYIFEIKNIPVYNLWYFPKDDTEKVFPGINKDKFVNGYLKSNSIFVSFYKNTSKVLILTPYKGINFWKRNHKIICENIFNRVNFLKNFFSAVKVKIISTPIDLHNLTYNYKGACYGWLPLKTTKEFHSNFLHIYNNIFLCGHWVPNIFGSGGITSVINSGRSCSRFILRKNG
ncbi:MAG: NAD(P)/FAD-dependent oxidoreductase, partial [Candidatus Omnitrophica bacterium]|nr:NAD(P)/FAD-dependent oxidoreductase [Candidatus Omnitrophota bacterium]